MTIYLAAKNKADAFEQFVAFKKLQEENAPNNTVEDEAKLLEELMNLK